jgi:hypothetical protein
MLKDMEIFKGKYDKLWKIIDKKLKKVDNNNIFQKKLLF